jgi:hypothetical protein
MLTELRNVWVNSVNGNNGIQELWYFYGNRQIIDMFFLENGLSGSGK